MFLRCRSLSLFAALLLAACAADTGGGGGDDAGGNGVRDSGEGCDDGVDDGRYGTSRSELPHRALLR